MAISSASTFFNNPVWGGHFHSHPQAHDFACLTDYVRALLRPQDYCECEWCKAEPLERAMATVVARKEKEENE